MSRRTLLGRILLAGVIALVPLIAGARPAEQQQRIDYLISDIEHLDGGAVFIRNGKEYDAKAAADHLRLKLRGAGEAVQTAEDFIARCATASSMSGQKYRIRLGSGKEMDSADYLKERLAAYRPPG